MTASFLASHLEEASASVFAGIPEIKNDDHLWPAGHSKNLNKQSAKASAGLIIIPFSFLGALNLAQRF